MYELIFLGLIPGTQLQISFHAWVAATVALLAAVSFWQVRRWRLFRSWLRAWRVAHAIRRSCATLTPYSFYQARVE
jgi:hypothetical protein